MLLTFPLLIALAGTLDTLRCMKTRWSLYHGGVLLLLYMDLMADAIILFFLLYPFWTGIASAN
ncbi:MAG TPA: permease [Terracidiphilus sp.]|nr:permease [Terracidiphilus sp.]